MRASGHGKGKIILLGEHAVVYGYPALAAALPQGVKVRLSQAESAGKIRCAAWGLDQPLDTDSSLSRAIRAVLQASGLQGPGWDLEVDAEIPAGAGLGSSAALCVAIARAAGQIQGKSVSAHEASQAAFEGERCFHGTPSGIDNTIAASEGVLWFCKPDRQRFLSLSQPIPLVLAQTGQAGETAAEVAKVRRYVQAHPKESGEILERMGRLVEQAEPMLIKADWTHLGSLMNQAHTCLSLLGVSTPALDQIVSLAMSAGAAGAKLTGAGGGGCAIALCPEQPEKVAAALAAAGFPAWPCIIEPAS